MINMIIVGAGGLGREVYRMINNSAMYNLKGFLSDDKDILEGYAIKAPIVGSPFSYIPQKNDRFIMAIGTIDTKKKIVESLESSGAIFKSFVHPSSIVFPTATIGEGSVIFPFCFISDNVVVGEYSMFGFYASCGHDAQVGKYSILSPYATVNGFTVLEDEVFMGTHSSVAARKRVGYKAKISSGSAAMYDVPSNAFVCGVPGKSDIIFNK